jgi:hypothetical protein
LGDEPGHLGGKWRGAAAGAFPDGYRKQKVDQPEDDPGPDQARNGFGCVPSQRNRCR